MHCFTGLVLEPRTHAVMAGTHVYRVHDPLERVMRIIPMDAMVSRSQVTWKRHLVTQLKPLDPSVPRYAAGAWWGLVSERCPAPPQSGDLWEVQAMLILHFGLIICSLLVILHVAFCLHLVPHGLHLCQVNCIWTLCRQLCFNLLGYQCSCFKNRNVQIFKSQTPSIPFRVFAFRPPSLLNSFPLTSWTLNKNKTLRAAHVSR